MRLIVADTGTGIPAERLPRVFEPFANQTQMFPGSLELAVVHGIVTQSGGTIHVRSEDGRGTTFTLDFPAAVDADGPEHEARPIGGRETILLVEDDAAVRALLASTLERQGYGVMAVHGAAEAMAPVPGSVQGLIVDLGSARRTRRADCRRSEPALPRRARGLHRGTTRGGCGRCRSAARPAAAETVHAEGPVGGAAGDVG